MPIDRYPNPPADADARYAAASALVAVIDRHLERGYHYRDERGRLLVSLDEVVPAILRDELAVPEVQR